MESVAVASLMWLFLLQPEVGVLANIGWLNDLFPTLKDPGLLRDDGVARSDVPDLLGREDVAANPDGFSWRRRLNEPSAGVVHRHSRKAEAFAGTLKTSTRSVATDSGAKQALFVEIAMVANFANKQAEKFRPAVAKAASQYKVSQSLVFAIIRTESNFNPFAVSSAPAYGLMQLVPTSGGREALLRFRHRKREQIAATCRLSVPQQPPSTVRFGRIRRSSGVMPVMVPTACW